MRTGKPFVLDSHLKIISTIITRNLVRFGIIIKIVLVAELGACQIVDNIIDRIGV